MLWKEVNRKEEKNYSGYIVIICYKMMSSQCVLLLCYHVNTGEGTQIGVLIPMRGSFNYSYDKCSCSQPELTDASEKQNRFSEADWEKTTPKYL